MLTTSRLSATAEVRDSAGNPIASSPPPPKKWDESLRYYRVCESSEDLFDSFRNLYLALESILSSIVPTRKTLRGSPEGEGAWLERSLKHVAATVDLSEYAPADSKKSAPNAIHDELYGNLRTAIFHAKAGRRAWLPQDWTSRAAIAEARVRYALLFRKLASIHLDIGYPGGGIFKDFWEESLVNAVLKDCVVYVSDDPTNLVNEPRGEYNIAPAGGRVFELPTAGAEDMARDWCRGIRGVASGSEVLQAIRVIQRFGVLRDGQLAMVESLVEPLWVDEAHKLDIVFLVEGRNYGQPHRDFES